MGLLGKLNKDDLPEPYKDLAEDIGLDATLRLAERYGGRQVYFPQVGIRALKQRRDHEIKRKYTGYNTQDIAQEYGISERQVRRIAKARR
ncbi:MAG: Mor transcription activator family protein [Eubacteriales bacterium]|nr:Mor transcription activator family protein [Eubacteriales bacterium]